MVVAYADTTKNGPSTEADTSITKEFLRLRIVRFLTLWSRKASVGSVNLRSTLAVEAYTREGSSRSAAAAGSRLISHRL
jgi:hypothetical protein